jgi:hypothetical protein
MLVDAVIQNVGAFLSSLSQLGVITLLAGVVFLFKGLGSVAKNFLSAHKPKNLREE